MNVSHPKADDFRVEMRGAELVVTFAPTAAVFVFDTVPPNGDVGPKSVHMGGDSNYSDSDVRRIAIELAQVARRGMEDGPADL